MKRVISLFVALCLFVAPVVALAEIDLSGMSLAELSELQRQITLAMFATDEWQEVEVPAGMYEVGKDIPAGYWTISINVKDTASLKLGTRCNSSRTEIDYKDTITFAQISHPDDGYYKYNPVASVAWNLSDGMFIKIEDAPVVFSPYVSKPLGFK